MEIIYIENIRIELTYKNIKNINLRIQKPNGNVKISAPFFTSKRSIKKFVTNNLDWILKSQQKVIEQGKEKGDLDCESTNKFESGDVLYVWGEKYKLQVLPANRWNLELNTSNHTAYLYATKNSDTDKRKNYVKKFYRNILLEKSKPIFEKWRSQTSLVPSKIDVRFTKSNWGSCMKSTGRIMLNGQLASMPPKFLDYVILHELAHLKYPNHGDKFKDFLTKYMPDWKQIKKEMR